MIRHCALFRFKPDTGEERIGELLAGFVTLSEKVDGMKNVLVGPNVSDEGIDKGFAHGLIVDFPNEQARDAYLVHPAHLAHAEAVVACLDGGLDGVVAFDLKG